ncbi:hypothetical protein GGP41_002724 [Bipolaris sorokiniana]|nr:hypothetical protein GGP41_002724 [Bipolaris sorokiniana]
MLLRTLFTDGSIRAYVTLFRPGNEQKRELNAGKMWVKIALAPSEPSSEIRQQDARRQATKEENHFDVSDTNNPEAIFLVSVGRDVNGDTDRLHGGIISALLD